MAARKQMNDRITPEAWDGWDRAKRSASVHRTDLVEAVGRSLADRSFEFPPEIIERAQQIMYDRNT